MSKRKGYSPEYKQELVDLARRSKSSYRKTALEVGVTPALLTRWVRAAEAGVTKAFPGGGTPPKADVECRVRYKSAIEFLIETQNGRASLNSQQCTKEGLGVSGSRRGSVAIGPLNLRVNSGSQDRLRSA
ncbi:MAG: hypothetical protein DCF27_00395 [Lysobacteraceae bacterium]|nr:MAG: hypothetical protein DCF27_00395 [Xanthomonadaceae bacterium]